MRILLALLALVTLQACSSIVEGTSQEILVNTTPSGADCSLVREGISIARNKSDVAGATVGNIILGGIGWAIDSASGVDNKYTSPVNIPMSKK